jgi:hypothetical protein
MSKQASLNRESAGEIANSYNLMRGAHQHEITDKITKREAVKRLSKEYNLSQNGIRRVLDYAEDEGMNIYSRKGFYDSFKTREMSGEISEMLSQGHNFYQISEALGVSRKFASSIMRDYSDAKIIKMPLGELGYRSVGTPEAGDPNEFPGAFNDLIKRHGVKKGRIDELAEEHGLSKEELTPLLVDYLNLLKEREPFYDAQFRSYLKRLANEEPAPAQSIGDKEADDDFSLGDAGQVISEEPALAQMGGSGEPAEASGELVVLTPEQTEEAEGALGDKAISRAAVEKIFRNEEGESRWKKIVNYTSCFIAGAALGATLTTAAITGLMNYKSHQNQKPAVVQQVQDKRYAPLKEIVDNQGKEIKGLEGKIDGKIKESNKGLVDEFGKLGNEIKESYKKLNEQMGKYQEENAAAHAELGSRIDNYGKQSREAQEKIGAQISQIEGRQNKADERIGSLEDRLNKPKEAAAPIPAETPSEEGLKPNLEGAGEDAGRSIKPKAEITPALENRFSSRISGISGDLRGAEEVIGWEFKNTNDGYDYRGEILNRNERGKADGEHIVKSMSATRNEFTAIEGDYNFGIGVNLGRRSEDRKRDSFSREISNEAVPFIRTDETSWNERLDEELSSIYGTLGKGAWKGRMQAIFDRRKTRADSEIDTNVIFPSNPIPPLNLTNDIDSWTRINKTTLTGEVDYAIAPGVDIGVIGREMIIGSGAKARVNGIVVGESEDSFRVNSIGGRASYKNEEGTTIAGMTGLVNNGGRLEDNQKFEGDGYFINSLNNNFYLSLGGSRVSGEAMGRVTMIYNNSANENSGALGALENLEKQRAEQELFPETTFEEQKRLDMLSALGRAAQEGILFSIGGERENWELATGMPIVNGTSAVLRYGQEDRGNGKDETVELQLTTRVSENSEIGLYDSYTRSEKEGNKNAVGVGWSVKF